MNEIRERARAVTKLVSVLDRPAAIDAPEMYGLMVELVKSGRLDALEALASALKGRLEVNRGYYFVCDGAKVWLG